MAFLVESVIFDTHNKQFNSMRDLQAGDRLSWGSREFLGSNDAFFLLPDMQGAKPGLMGRSEEKGLIRDTNKQNILLGRIFHSDSQGTLHGTVRLAQRNSCRAPLGTETHRLVGLLKVLARPWAATGVSILRQIRRL